ncbi:MAG: hypothetical protein WA705_04215 [Candidatus Ozemobacteraceae bacterium]
MPKKSKKEWKPIALVEMPWWQKGLIGSVTAFLPFFIFVILPMMARNHIVNKMKLSEDLILNPPIIINLVKSGEATSTIRLALGGVTFQVPRSMTPVELTSNSVVFRQSPRRDDRTLSIQVRPRAPEVDLGNDFNIGRLFMPSDTFSYMTTALYATWHPVRMMCKATLLASQGVSSRFFEALWAGRHTGYIFPTPANSGYIGRIFGANPGPYVEFSYYDEVHPVTLRQWVNLAMEIRLKGDPDPKVSENQPSPIPLAETLERIREGRGDNGEVVETSLNQYFSTGNASWALPLANILSREGFLHEIIEFQRTFSGAVRNDEQLKRLWSKVLDDSLKSILKIDIDTHLQQNLLMATFKNSGRFALKNIQMKITLFASDTERSFTQTLFREGTLQAGGEETLQIPPPEGMTVRGVQTIAFNVETLEVVD